jgi:1-phosphofructokinase family hexose kinase
VIYTITFNPALDVSGVVDQLIPNEKSYVYNEAHCAGGNGLNSGLIAQRLGSKVILTGFLGGTNGDEIKSLLSKNKMKHEFVSIAGSTRMNFTISNKKDHNQTRLSFPGPHIKKGEKNELLQYMKKIIKNDIVIIGGSLPPGLSSSYVKSLLKEVRKNDIRCMVDMPGTYLKEIVRFKPDFIKPNLTEFQTLVGKKVTSIKTVIPLALKLLDYVPHICISSVEGGALLITKEEIWFGKLPKVKIRSTVGAGDSMVGAMASLWNRKPEASVSELLRLGLAASCATLTESGLTLGSKKSILHFESKIILKQIA